MQHKMVPKINKLKELFDLLHWTDSAINQIVQLQGEIHKTVQRRKNRQKPPTTVSGE